MANTSTLWPAVSDPELEACHFAVLDIEATGLDTHFDEIIEIAVRDVSLRSDAEVFHSLVKPLQPVPEVVTQLTGLSNQDLANAPLMHQVFEPMRRAIATRHALVAHNAHFDAAYLAHARRHHDQHAVFPPALCTLKLARELLPNLHSYALADLATQFGWHVPGHRASSDAAVTAQLLQLLLQRAMAKGARTLSDLRAMQQRSKSAEPPPLRLPIAELPVTPGIYKFMGGDHCLYLGYTQNIQSRVRAHFQDPHDALALELAKRAVRVEHESSACKFDAALRSQTLLPQARPSLQHHAEQPECYLLLEEHPAFVSAASPLAIGPLTLARSTRDVRRALETVFQFPEKRGRRPIDYAPLHAAVRRFLHAPAEPELTCSHAQRAALRHLRAAVRLRQLHDDADAACVGASARLITPTQQLTLTAGAPENRALLRAFRACTEDTTLVREPLDAET